MSIDALNTLRARFRGHILQAGDSGYDEARKVYNGMIDRRPRIIARCVDAADVMAAVDYGRDNKLLTAVRGGGHNGGGLGVCDDGLVIDLSGMRSTRVNPAARTGFPSNSEAARSAARTIGAPSGVAEGATNRTVRTSAVAPRPLGRASFTVRTISSLA